MSRPGPALSFYLKHGSDVAALLELDSPPEGVLETDWVKFRRVADMAHAEGVSLLVACREAIFAGLGDAVRVVGNGAQRSAVLETWDNWRLVKPPGDGKDATFGYVGVCFDVYDDNGGLLVGYIRPNTRYSSNGASLREALGAAVPDQERGFTEETAIVFSTRVTADDDLEQVTHACGKAFVGVRAAIKTYLTGPLVEQ